MIIMKYIVLLVFMLILCPCGRAEVSVSPAVERDAGRFIIGESGVYTISGEDSDIQIIVQTARDIETTLILDNADLTCSDGAAILGISGKMDIRLVGESSVRGGGDGQPAAIYSADDITIGGEGKLYVYGDYKHGVESRDDLRVYGGDIYVEAAHDALRGRERLEIRGGRIICVAGNDGLKANSDAEGALGGIAISGGEIELSVGDDGVRAEGKISVSGGTLNIIGCYEGVEAREIEIFDGDINIVSTDDALNANGDVTSYIAFYGGRLRAQSQGDGIDSNGHLELNGGEITVHGSTSRRNSPIDYDGGCVARETLIYASGSATMAKAPKSVDGGSTFRLYFDEMRPKGESVEIYDAFGNLLIEFCPLKDFQVIIIVHPALRAGDEIAVMCGENGDIVFKVTLDNEITSVNQRGEPCDYLSNDYGW